MAFVVITNLMVLVLKFVDPPLSPLMLIRSAQQWSNNKPVKIRQEWRDFKDIDQDLFLAMMAGEDQKFYDHAGFDWEAIDNAIDHNEVSAKKIGASTITQQLAKNLFLWPGRDWIRKGLEAYFTLVLEFWMSKNRILELYANIVEMGDGIYGVEAATRQYYNHGCKKVTAAEAAALAAILPRPLGWSPVRPNAQVQKRKTWILGQMRNLKVLENA